MAQCPLKWCRSQFLDVPGQTYGFWLLRLFLGVVFVNAFIGKLQGESGLDLANLAGFQQYIAHNFAGKLPDFLLVPYGAALPWLELILGLTVLLGVKTRLSLFFMGLTYISLAYGQLLMRDGAHLNQIAMLLLMTVAAVCLSKYDGLALWSESCKADSSTGECVS